MASKGLKFFGWDLDSEGSTYDVVIDNGIETKIQPLIDVDNPHRLRHIFVASND